MSSVRRQFVLGFLRFLLVAVFSQQVLLQIDASFAQESSSAAPDVAPYVSETPEVFTLRHRFELEPKINASWRVYPEKPPLSIDLEKIVSEDLEYLFSISRQIVNLAKIRGVAERDRVFETLVKRLVSSPERRLGLALVSAACALEPTSSEMESLWNAVKDSDSTRLPVEQLLVARKSKLGLEVWRTRLGSRENTGTSALLVAIEGLGIAGDESDLSTLRGILQDSNELITLRIAAAKSLGQVASAGLEELAREQLVSENQLKELVAGYLLAQHRSALAAEILTSIVESDAVAAQLVALAALVDANPAKAREYAEQFSASADSALRHQVIRLFAKLGDADSVAWLSTALAGRVESNRNLARQLLVKKAKIPALRQSVAEQLDRILLQGDYLQREQACLLAGELKYRGACPALFDLLNDSHPRTRNAAAWALQELVSEPEHLQRIEAILTEATGRNFGPQPLAPAEAVKVAFLIEALGRNNFQSANKTLVRYIRKGSAEPVLRAAAIWTLGKNLQGKPNRRLANMLAQRLNDNSPSPESPLVQFTCAIAMGMMGDPSSEAELRLHETRPPFPRGLARQWALEQYQAESAN